MPPPPLSPSSDSFTGSKEASMSVRICETQVI
jgi:hypothetical protein